MNCKVCGNAVNDHETVCSICGNDMEAQRRDDAPARQIQDTSLTNEKNEAINRILYDGGGSSAKDRLEERRRKRQAERAASHTGIPSLFSNEKKEKSAVPSEPPEPSPIPEREPEAEAVFPEPEEKPKRRFSNEFVFGPRPTYEPEPEQSEISKSPVPGQQTFSIPEVPEPAPEPPAPEPPAPEPPAPEPQAVPRAYESDTYFTLTQSDEEQAKFEVDKKNEEFQELLDKEFERLKNRETTEVRSQFEPPEDIPAPPPSDDTRSYIQDRIDSFLQKSDLDLAREMRTREEEPKIGFEAVKTPKEEEGLAFDGKDYGHAFSHGEVPVSDFDINKSMYESAKGTGDPIQDLLKAGETNQEFTPVPEKPKSDLTYADLELFDFKPEEVYVPEPAPTVPEFAPSAPAPATPMESRIFGGPDISALFDKEDSAEIEKPKEPTPWGHSKNEAPTRESIAAFMDRPIEFPFDTKQDIPVPASETPKKADFDFEPLESLADIAEIPEPFAAPIPEPPAEPEPPVIPESPAEPVTPVIPPPVQELPEEPIPEPPVIPESPEASVTPIIPEPPVIPEPFAEQAASVPEPLEIPENLGIPEPLVIQEAPPATEFAAPFSFDTFGKEPVTEEVKTEEPVTEEIQAEEQVPAETNEIAEEPAPLVSEKVEDPSDWFITPSITPPEPPVIPEPEPEPEPQSEATADVPEAIAAEEPKAEEPKAEEPKAEEPAAETPIDLSSFDEITEEVTEPAEDEKPPEATEPITAQEAPDAKPESTAPDFVDLMTSAAPAEEEDKLEDDDTDGPPRFYKEYTQGFSIPKPEDIETSAQVQSPEKPAEVLPEFLTAYDKEQLGRKEGEVSAEGKPDKSEQKVSKEDKKDKKQPKERRKTESKRTALSVVITILIIILVIVVACIIVLKMMPDSIGAYYIQDFIQTIQARLGIGGSA